MLPGIAATLKGLTTCPECKCEVEEGGIFEEAIQICIHDRAISEREYLYSTVLSTYANSMEQQKSDILFPSLVLSSMRKDIYKKRLANLGQVLRQKSESAGWRKFD